MLLNSVYSAFAMTIAGIIWVMSSTSRNTRVPRIRNRARP